MTKNNLKNTAIPYVNQLYSTGSVKKRMARMLILDERMYSSAEMEKNLNISSSAISSYLHELRKHFEFKVEKQNGRLCYTVVDMNRDHSERLMTLINSVFQPIYFMEEVEHG